jgi:hypothetical protein
VSPDLNIRKNYSRKGEAKGSGEGGKIEFGNEVARESRREGSELKRD